jgi:hypothetical protein
VNDPPVNTVPLVTQTTAEDEAITFAAGVLAVLDPEAAFVQVTLFVSHGTLTLGSTTDVSIDAGGQGQANIQFTGSQAAVNNALSGLVYQPALN